MVTKRELFLEKELAKYKKLGAPPKPFKDRRDLMIVWLIEEKIRDGHSVSRSVQLVQKKDELKFNLSVSTMRNLYNQFKKTYDPKQVFEVHGSLTMLPTNEWKKLTT